MDIACVVSKNEDICEYYAQGYEVRPVAIADLAIKTDEKFTSEALIRGILARFRTLGYKIGGFKAYAQSAVLKGSGISSSVAFEVLIGTILSHLYHDGQIDPIVIAQIGQYAENNYFMKPCGLMDQLACAIGGFVTIDFKDKAAPKVEKIDFDFANSDHVLCIVDTKGDHADLSDEYALMPAEMQAVAKVLGKEMLSQVTKQEILDNLALIREKCDDRSLLRALHFVEETERVVKEATALKNKDMEGFKRLVIESGYSSFMYLQNVFSPKDYKHQELAVALWLSENLLKGKGAYRVHGGGLAGTIQAFVPKAMLDEYVMQMEAAFGVGSCFKLSIRPVGAYKIV